MIYFALYGVKYEKQMCGKNLERKESASWM